MKLDRVLFKVCIVYLLLMFVAGVEYGMLMRELDQYKHELSTMASSLQERMARLQKKLDSQAIALHNDHLDLLQRRGESYEEPITDDAIVIDGSVSNGN